MYNIFIILANACKGNDRNSNQFVTVTHDNPLTTRSNSNLKFDVSTTKTLISHPLPRNKPRPRRNATQFDRGLSILFELAPDYISKKKSLLLKEVINTYVSRVL